MICPETQEPCPRLIELAVGGDVPDPLGIGEFPHDYNLVIDDGSGKKIATLLPYSASDLIETFALRDGTACRNNTTGECGIIEAIYKGLSGLRGEQ